MIDLKLNDYVDLINAIYKRAYLEQNNIQQFNQVEDLLNNKLKFKLAKHFDIKLYDSGKILFIQIDKVYSLSNFLFSNQENFKLSKAASTVINRKLSTPSGRVSALKSISKQQVTEQNNLIANYNYKLVDLHEIRYSFDVIYCSLYLIYAKFPFHSCIYIIFSGCSDSTKLNFTVAGQINSEGKSSKSNAQD